MRDDEAISTGTQPAADSGGGTEREVLDSPASPSGSPETESPAGPTGWSRFAGLHTRTFEMELLISGAVVFGLIQLPPIVGAGFARFRAGLAEDIRLVGSYGEVYVTLVLYALIASFVCHLILRAVWIGLVGLESVYPNGIRWERLKVGPRVHELYRQRVPSLARAIDHVDDVCSQIFSFGFLVVISFAYSVVLVILSFALAFPVAHLTLGPEHVAVVFWVVLCCLLAAVALPAGIDQVLGPRIAPGGVLGRLLRGAVRIGYAISPMRWIGPVQLTLQTNQSTTRITAAVVGAMGLLAIVQVGGLLVSEGVVRFERGGYFPTSLRDNGVDPRHYRDRRSPRMVLPKFPSIQSEVIDGRYVELSLPYYPRRLNDRVVEVCPDLEPLRPVGFAFGRPKAVPTEKVRRAARCLGSLFEMRVDGEVLEDLHFDFGIEVGSGLEALVTRIRIDDLAPGRHELVVLAPSGESRSQDHPPEPVRHLIPFWT